jgi:hypothetical protein
MYKMSPVCKKKVSTATANLDYMLLPIFLILDSNNLSETKGTGYRRTNNKINETPLLQCHLQCTVLCN